jgi:hypothetical protein
MTMAFKRSIAIFKRPSKTCYNYDFSYPRKYPIGTFVVCQGIVSEDESICSDNDSRLPCRHHQNAEPNTPFHQIRGSTGHSLRCGLHSATHFPPCYFLFVQKSSILFGFRRLHIATSSWIHYLYSPLQLIQNVIDNDVGRSHGRENYVHPVPR